MPNSTPKKPRTRKPKGVPIGEKPLNRKERRAAQFGTPETLAATEVAATEPDAAVKPIATPPISPPPASTPQESTAPATNVPMQETIAPVAVIVAGERTAPKKRSAPKELSTLEQTAASAVLAAPEKVSAPKITRAPKEVFATNQAAAPNEISSSKEIVTSKETVAPQEISAPWEPASSLFADLELKEPIARAVAEMGFETPTPIQERAIPLLLAGHDLIGQAQTGTGKTAAFALPMIQKIDTSRQETQALVLAPTRELAVQVASGIHDLAKYMGLRVVPIYGGQPIDRQLRALRSGAHIVVGTPGRVQDHLRRGSLSLSDVSFCVLDEADEMLALGFVEEITAILAELPAERQLAFFSATIPPRISALMKRFLREPKHVSIESGQRTLETTNQAYYEVARGQKLEALARILDMETPGPTIVFCRTRQETIDLSEALQLRGHGAEPINGDMSQADRERVLRRFRDGQSDLLVATDVAARGLDIDNVTHVINFGIPFDVEQYIHRVGRTGRAGRTGDAITLVEARERRQLKLIERLIGATIKPVRLPTAADIAARRRDTFKDALRQTLEAGEFDGYLSTVEELSESFDPTEIAAAALQMLWHTQNGTSAETANEVAADGEQPESGMVRVFIGMGRQDNLRAGDLVGAITGETGLTGRDIGAIDLLDRSSFVEIPIAHADRVVAALRQTKLRGRRVNVQIAHPQDA